MRSILKLLIFFITLSGVAEAQFKVVVMGSSTAFGVGASTYANSWVGKTESYLNRNSADGLDTFLYNIARPGYDSYQEMPDGFIPPPGRPYPDDSFNISRALSFDPDVIIISLPSNDVNYGYAKSETMSNFRQMNALANAAGARCYFTTAQPRNDLSQPLRDSLFSMVDSVMNAFGAYAVNFWDSLVTTDGLHALKDEYRAIPSPLHLNNAGHDLLFQKIRDSYIFSFSPLNLSVRDLSAQMQGTQVAIQWHTDIQPAQTIFELQRSNNGNKFETISMQNVREAVQYADFFETDHRPLRGANYYRVKIISDGKYAYSRIVKVMNDAPDLSLSNLTVNSSILSFSINLQKDALISMTILNSSGAKMIQQTEFVQRPGETITLPLSRLGSGQYYLRVSMPDGTRLVQPFVK